MVWAAVACALVVLILLIAFILQNQEYVQVKFFGLEGSVPLGIALFIAAVGGGVLVAIAGAARIIQLRLAAHRGRRRRPARARARADARQALTSFHATQNPGAGPITTAAADWPDVERLFGVRGEPSRSGAGSSP